MHENKPGFTRGQRIKLRLVQARLDFWLISVQLEYQVQYLRVASGKGSHKPNIKNLFLNELQIPKLSEMDKTLCEKPLTIEECTKALKLLKK